MPIMRQDCEERVGRITHLDCFSLDILTQLGGDPGMVAKGEGNGGMGNAEFCGDVAHGDAGAATEHKDAIGNDIARVSVK